MKRQFLLVLLIGLSGCLDFTTIDDVDCPDGGTPLTYDNFGRPFMAVWCNRCHSARVEDRQGAPVDVVLDTKERVRALRDRIFARAAADNDSMPPGPDNPPRAERDRLAVWLACGAN
ncbi:MAG: hypothetical protein KC776_39115 [Myxococcales bacterium]|nr:hypothetical protein [Myxococcales bacterium]